jgi:hypothetical protein
VAFSRECKNQKKTMSENGKFTNTTVIMATATSLLATAATAVTPQPLITCHCLRQPHEMECGR